MELRIFTFILLVSIITNKKFFSNKKLNKSKVKKKMLKINKIFHKENKEEKTLAISEDQNP